MKYLKLFISLILLITSCSKKEEVQKIIFPIGKGIEIYEAKLTWDIIVSSKIRVINAELIDKEPIVNYNDLQLYENVSIQGRKIWLFKFEKEPIELFKNFYGNDLASKPDTGYVVTLDKEPIFVAYEPHELSAKYFREVRFGISKTPQPPWEINHKGIYLVWDSMKNGGGYRNEPDPRYDPRLLNRLRQDGKLKE